MKSTNRTGGRKQKRPGTSAKKRPRGAPASVLLQVRRSQIHGRGVYALESIPKGRRIIEYAGTVLPWEDATEQAEGAHTFLFGLSNGKDVIDPAVGGNDARWINHSCEPNCEAIEEGNRVFIHALTSLSPGEELFYDYGLEVDEPRTRALEKEYACFCGTATCRGTLLDPEEPSRASARATKRKPKERLRKRKARS